VSQALGEIPRVARRSGQPQGGLPVPLRADSCCPCARRAEGDASPGRDLPVVYRFDFAEANTYHLADRFPVRDKDIIFVADAAAVQINKLFSVFSTLTGPFITEL